MEKSAEPTRTYRNTIKTNLQSTWHEKIAWLKRNI